MLRRLLSILAIFDSVPVNPPILLFTMGVIVLVVHWVPPVWTWVLRYGRVLLLSLRSPILPCSPPYVPLISVGRMLRVGVLVEEPRCGSSVVLMRPLRKPWQCREITVPNVRLCVLR